MHIAEVVNFHDCEFPKMSETDSPQKPSFCPPKKFSGQKTGGLRIRSSGDSSSLLNPSTKPSSRKKSSRANGTTKSNKLNARSVQQREDEINQCLHTLSNKSFKLFKKGQYVSSYGLNLDIQTLSKAKIKFNLNVPHDYPSSPIKLHCKRVDSTVDALLADKLQTLVRNFNIKARDMLRDEPIITQLNYLVYKADLLSMPEFKQIEKREQSFYAAFT